MSHSYRDNRYQRYEQQRDQNGSKRDKKVMGSRNNNRIAQREFEEAEFTRQGFSKRLDVDRIMLERQLTRHNYENDDDMFVGEVTGEEFDSSNIFDKGMPVRSSYTVKKSRFDNNTHLDFDLYEKFDKRSTNKVEYADTSAGDYADLVEAMKSITDGADPYESCITDVNTTTCWMHSNMYRLSKDDYIVNGFGLFSGFGSLYMISRGNTNIEMKNYFGFQDKKHLNAGLLTIKDDIKDYRDQIVIHNYIINDKDVTTDTDTGKRLQSLLFNVVINRDYPREESERINKIIKKLSGMSDAVSYSTVGKMYISLLSVGKLSPIWAYKVDGVINSRFRNTLSGNSYQSDYIRFIGKTYDYFEDAEIQLAEIPMYGDKFTLGVILPKNQQKNTPTELKDIGMAINYLKPTVLDEVIIPVIKKRYKTRLNKTLQKTGLEGVFTNDEIVGLFPEGGSIGDCVQYIDLSFSTKCANKRCDNKGYRTTRKMLADRTFEFYLRNRDSNCILMMGRI